MAYVKLDTGILDSTLWANRDERDMFVTSLLLAEPKEITEPTEQIEVDRIEPTGFVVPPGWYGFVPAAGIGIARRALVAVQDGIEALRRLGSPDPESRTAAHDGRRMVRVDGGYLILNFMAYRDKDHTAAARARRYRERKRHGVTSRDSSLAVASAVAPEEQQLSASPDGDAPPVASDPIPYQAVVDAFNRSMANLPKARDLTTKRRTLIRSAWQAAPKRRSMRFWAAYFELCAEDAFLNGTGPYTNGHENWRPSFDYLLRADVVTRVVERALDANERAKQGVAHG